MKEMRSEKELRSEHNLCLTEEEAMGLLDIVLMSPADLSPEQRTALVKLSEFCRAMLRESAESNPVKSTSTLNMSNSAIYAA